MNNRDRGSFSILFAVGVLMIMGVIGLSIDGGGQMRARQLAADIASEAARAGGQGIDMGQAVPGTDQVINRAQAITNINTYLSSVRTNLGLDIPVPCNTVTSPSPCAGNITFSTNNKQIRVTIEIRYHTKIIKMFGKTELDVQATATGTLLVTAT